MYFKEKELVKSPEFQKKEVPMSRQVPDKFIQVTITKKKHKPSGGETAKDGEMNSKMYRLGALKFFEDSKWTQVKIFFNKGQIVRSKNQTLYYGRV